MARKKTATKKATRRKRIVTHKVSTPAAEISPQVKKTRGRTGKPAFVPTEEQQKNVKAMVGYGMKQEAICALVRNPYTDKPIDLKTLRAHFREELDSGGPQFEQLIAQSLSARALDPEHPQGATCAIFLAKTRLGYREEPFRVEADVKTGVLVTGGSSSPEDWIAASMGRSAKAEEPE